MPHPCCICHQICYCAEHIEDGTPAPTPPDCLGCGCEDNEYWPAGITDFNRDDHCPDCGQAYSEADHIIQICSVCKYDNSEKQTLSPAEICRICGCHDQIACTHPVFGACWWAEAASVDPDGVNFVGALCSHCALQLEGVYRPWKDDAPDALR